MARVSGMCFWGSQHVRACRRSYSRHDNVSAIGLHSCGIEATFTHAAHAHTKLKITHIMADWEEAMLLDMAYQKHYCVSLRVTMKMFRVNLIDPEPEYVTLDDVTNLVGAIDTNCKEGLKKLKTRMYSHLGHSDVELLPYEEITGEAFCEPEIAAHFKQFKHYGVLQTIDRSVCDTKKLTKEYKHWYESTPLERFTNHPNPGMCLGWKNKIAKEQFEDFYAKLHLVLGRPLLLERYPYYCMEC